MVARILKRAIIRTRTTQVIIMTIIAAVTSSSARF